MGSGQRAERVGEQLWQLTEGCSSFSLLQHVKWSAGNALVNTAMGQLERQQGMGEGRGVEREECVLRCLAFR